MHDLMRLYYGRLFPFQEIYRCARATAASFTRPFTRQLARTRASAGSPTATTQDCHTATPPFSRFALQVALRLGMNCLSEPASLAAPRVLLYA